MSSREHSAEGATQADAMTGHSVRETEMMRRASAADTHLSVGGEETTALKEAVGTGAGAVAPERGQSGNPDTRYRRAREGFQRHCAQQPVGPGLAQQGDEAAQRGTDASRTRTFEDVEQRHRSGYEAGGDARCAARSFEDVEPELRREYERQYPQTDRWEHLRDQVRTGFHSARHP